MNRQAAIDGRFAFRFAYGLSDILASLDDIELPRAPPRAVCHDKLLVVLVHELMSYLSMELMNMSEMWRVARVTGRMASSPLAALLLIV